MRLMGWPANIEAMGNIIYLDNHATTRLDPRVLTKMMPFLQEEYGNAGSDTHAYGWNASEAVEAARESVAALVGATAKEIVWTSGATESDNMALLGVMLAPNQKKTHIITQVTEHKAVLETCHELEARGFQVTFLPVNADGRVDPGDVKRAITPATALVSVMLANNEIGVVQPIAEIGALCRAHGILFHVDAAQGLGLVDFNVRSMGIDLASISGHKMYGPKGVGALYVRRRGSAIDLKPTVFGGGQERSLRPGTLNVPAIVGLGEATRLALAEGEAEATRLQALRSTLHDGLRRTLDGLLVNGTLEHRHPGNLNFCIEGVSAQKVLAALRDVACSSGSACASKSGEPSYVLKAIGRSDVQAFSALRLGIGRFTTSNDIEHVIKSLASEIQNARRAA